MGKNRDLEEYERETRTFEEELVSGPFFLKWIFLAWICFEPFLAITWAGHFWLGDTLYFSLYLIFWALPGAFLAVIFGAMRIAQIIISTFRGLNTIWGILFLLLQFLTAPLAYWIFGWDFAQEYFFDTLTFDFLALTLIVGLSFFPVVLKNRKIWFFPLFLYAFLAPASILVYFYFRELELLGLVSTWRYLGFFGGVLLQVLVCVLSTSLSALRGFSREFFGG
ncbi:MAG: hypothetical protein NUV70_01420 [Caldiserica bacterium]|jgi:hypothetical protein|nr:hypothetical protein [Caldisericota bacterium]